MHDPDSHARPAARAAPGSAGEPAPAPALAGGDTAAAGPPAPPPIEPAADGSRRRRRVLGACAALATGGLLGIAAWLRPASAGIGTHEQLRLPECGWILTMDLPCPTCGMTTAFAHAADGALISSLLTQPLGGALAIGTAATCIAATCTAATGTGVFVRLVERWWSARLAWVAGAAVLGAWLFKMAAHRGVLG